MNTSYSPLEDDINEQVLQAALQDEKEFGQTQTQIYDDEQTQSNDYTAFYQKQLESVLQRRVEVNPIQTQTEIDPAEPMQDDPLTFMDVKHSQKPIIEQPKPTQQEAPKAPPVSENPPPKSAAISQMDQLFDFHQSYDADKVTQKELCSDHGLRKTSYCLECQKYICDRCLPMSKHSEHKTQHLSVIAFKVFQAVTNEFQQFEKNIGFVQEVRPHEWKTLIRDKLIKFFDMINERLKVLKEFSFKQLNAVIKSMNYTQLQKDIGDLEKCQDLIKNNYHTLKQAFENNHFSQIASRQKHYRAFIESLEILNLQGQNCREMVNSKLGHIKKIEQNLDRLKLKIKEKILEDKKLMTFQVSQELQQEQNQDTNKHLYITAFSVYVQEKKAQIATQNPKWSLLQVIAYLQERWSKEDPRVRDNYQGRAERMAQEFKMNLINQNNDYQKNGLNPVADVQKAVNASVNLTGTKRIFNIFYCQDIKPSEAQKSSVQLVPRKSNDSDEKYERRRQEKMLLKKKLIMQQKRANERAQAERVIIKNHRFSSEQKPQQYVKVRHNIPY
ncbi:hypothetical protein FGO68_gene2810 [Halteria grandinella]|uniref:B box-type domain-containing protein n=1 Tax=Halteria grandinella TaxID=5974 RepID=A0A8J8NTT5_HALGN|nr:hypothetical protein FGO68_gene2810 [Halteria grandinella]